MRLKKTYNDGPHTAKVYHDKEWEEHRVQFFTNGKHHKKADYHTDDIDDAHNTAQKWLKGKSVVKEENQNLSVQDFIDVLLDEGYEPDQAAKAICESMNNYLPFKDIRKKAYLTYSESYDPKRGYDPDKKRGVLTKVKTAVKRKLGLLPKTKGTKHAEYMDKEFPSKDVSKSERIKRWKESHLRIRADQATDRKVPELKKTDQYNSRAAGKAYETGEKLKKVKANATRSYNKAATAMKSGDEEAAIDHGQDSLIAQSKLPGLKKGKKFWSAAHEKFRKKANDIRLSDKMKLPNKWERDAANPKGKLGA